MADSSVASSPSQRRWLGRRSILLICLVALMAVGGAIWHLATRRPAGPAQGTSFNGQFPRPAEPRTTIRVGTYNIHGCVGRDHQLDYGRTADCLRDLDLVGLNEVHGGTPWQPQDQAEMLGRRLSLPWLFVPTERRWARESFGNAALTSLPVTSWLRIPQAGTQSSFRNMLLLGVMQGNTKINVLITHADHGPDRQMQLRAAISLFLSLAEPAILMGDMNSTIDDPQLQALLATPGVEDAASQADGVRPVKLIDWIITRGLRTVRSTIKDNGASDHPIVLAELELLPPG